jgi:LysM repeat protein
MFNIFAHTTTTLVHVLLVGCLGLAYTTADTIRQPRSVSVASVLNRSSLSTQISAAAGCSNPYIVRRGDTLTRIANNCGINVTTLKRLNGLRSDTIWVGQALTTRVPGHRIPVATPPPIAPKPTLPIESTVSPW